jgi:F-type H+-transporting ATPase subunit epsilon
MFTLSLVTPEKKLVTDLEIDEVIVPGYKGQLDILPGHAPLMTTLSVGILKYRAKGTTTYESVVLSWGYCEVHPEGVTILAETAESIDEIDKVRAEEALKRAKQTLENPTYLQALEVNEVEKLQRKMARAITRIEAGKETH